MGTIKTMDRIKYFLEVFTDIFMFIIEFHHIIVIKDFYSSGICFKLLYSYRMNFVSVTKAKCLHETE